MTALALEFERLNRLYSALRKISQAIVRTRTREDLFRRVSEVLVHEGGFRMAWIGWLDPETRGLVPAACAGHETAYLEGLVIDVDGRPEGRGPSGTAFHENRPYICNDIFEDPAALPWRTALGPWRTALDRGGFRACAAFPIHASERVAGTLTVYADRRDSFRQQEVALIAEAATDISFALDRLATEEARLREVVERKKAEAAAESEERFTASLVEAMPGVFYLYDANGRFLRWNRNFERVTGYSADEIAKMHPLDFFSGDEARLLERRISEVFAQGQATVEASFVSKDGTRTPYFFTGKHIVFDGAPCLIGVGVDVAERKRAEDAAEKSEERYRSTLDTILEGCQIFDFDWVYLYLNPAAAIQNRHPNAELLGRRLMDKWPGIEATPLFGILRRCMEERVPVHAETEYVFADGSTGWFDVRVQPVPEGIFVLSIDISERVHAARALRELNLNLERKVAERTRDLEAARTRAEAADRVKSAFLATMSHELRTPLNSILGFTGIVLKGMAGPLNEEQSKQLGMVQGSARHLLDLINDVLDISKIEAGQLEVRCVPFDVRASIERVVASVMPQAEKKGLAVRLEMPPGLSAMDGDRRRVEQILLNLLNNAIKFTDHGVVTVAIERLEAPDPGTPQPVMLIRVADTGIGMKEEDLSKLFQPFRQIDSGLQRQHEGTGLGLAICRRLTGLLGGTVSAESVWGQGSVFSVVLPMTRAGVP